MAIEYSIDLETLSTRSNAYILSIGVAAFDGISGEIIDKMHTKTVCGGGYHIDVYTVKWWLEQSEEARKSISEMDDVAHISTALFQLRNFVLASGGSPVVWGNGSSFDVSILEHAFNKECADIPWQHWNVRDMRTRVADAELLGFSKKSIKREGVHHSALDDAIYQAKVIFAAYEFIKRFKE